ISPLVGEMSGRTEGGAVERRFSMKSARTPGRETGKRNDGEAGGTAPPLPCRASPPHGGRLPSSCHLLRTSGCYTPECGGHEGGRE
ncbi:MAG: hypothetical protein EOQ61_26375, partial [Mesorhizobium sp.]